MSFKANDDYIPLGARYFDPKPKDKYTFESLVADLTPPEKPSTPRESRRSTKSGSGRRRIRSKSPHNQSRKFKEMEREVIDRWTNDFSFYYDKAVKILIERIVTGEFEVNKIKFLEIKIDIYDFEELFMRHRRVFYDHKFRNFYYGAYWYDDLEFVYPSHPWRLMIDSLHQVTGEKITEITKKDGKITFSFLYRLSSKQINQIVKDCFRS